MFKNIKRLLKLRKMLKEFANNNNTSNHIEEESMELKHYDDLKKEILQRQQKMDFLDRIKEDSFL